MILTPERCMNTQTNKTVPFRTLMSAMAGMVTVWIAYLKLSFIVFFVELSEALKLHSRSSMMSLSEEEWECEMKLVFFFLNWKKTLVSHSFSVWALRAPAQSHHRGQSRYHHKEPIASRDFFKGKTMQGGLSLLLDSLCEAEFFWRKTGDLASSSLLNSLAYKI